MTMMLLESDIPNFLYCSPYLKELVANEAFPEAGIEIPTGCAKADLSVNSSEDLIELLNTLRFWLVPELAEKASSMITFVLEKGNTAAMDKISEEYSRDIPFLKMLFLIAKAYPQERLTLAAGLGASTVVVYLYNNMDVSCFHFPQGNCSGYMRSTHPHNPKVACYISLTRYMVTLDELLTDKDRFRADALVVFAGAGRVDCLQALLESSLSFDNGLAPSDALFLAAKKGHTDCLQYIWSTCVWSADMYRVGNLISGAAAGGCLASFQFAIEVEISVFTVKQWAFHALLNSDDVVCLDYLHSVGMEMTISMPLFAIDSKSTKYFKYLLDHDCPTRGSECCVYAAGANNVELLKYAHGKGLPIDQECFVSAARTGSLDCVKYLHQQHCPWSAEICSIAAGAGSLACLQYLHKNGCPWDENTCAEAAKGMDAKTRLTCLTYAHKHGCPWDANTCTGAVGQGDLECLKYAHENGCPWDFDTGSCPTSVECFQYLVMHNCPGVEYNLRHMN